MARRIVLHIGAMKSGTSFLQNVLAAHRPELAAQDIRFAGERWTQQVKGVMDLIDRGGLRQPAIQPDGPWHSVAADINAWPETAILSVEFLGPRRRGKIKQVLDSFTGDPVVDVVLTARDLARVVPAMWQELVQNAGTATWEQFLDEVRDTPRQEGPGRWFWRQQDLAGIAERWSKAVGRDHFTIVTVPPAGGDQGLLWTRFAEAVGIDATGFDLDVRRNPSLGLVSTLVMRDLNERLDEDPLPRNAYHRFVKHGLAKRGTVHRKEPTLGLDEDWVLERGRAETEALRALGLRVAGDLDDLLPQPVKGVHPGDISTEDQLEAALAALAIAVRNGAQPGRMKARRG